MQFDYSNQTTLNLGNEQADHELTVVLNLGCPFCRKWYENNKKVLQDNINHNSLNIHLKFWNKDKPSLQNGNLANDYVDYQDPQAALAYIDEVYAAQNILDSLDHDGAAKFLKEELHANRHVDDQTAQQNTQEFVDNGLQSVPTIILDDKIVGDSNYQLADFGK